MQINKTIEHISDTQIRMVVEVTDGERVRSRRIYNLAKLPTQNADEVCRAVCPEAFPEVVSS